MPGFALLPEIMSSVTRAFHIGKVHGTAAQHRTWMSSAEALMYMDLQ